MEVDQDAIPDAIKASQRSLSMEASTTDEEGEHAVLRRRIPQHTHDPQDQGLDNQPLSEDVDLMLGVLDARQRDILRRYYGIGYPYPMTLGKIGDHYHITRERIRQLKQQALETLRQSPYVKTLRSYLDHEASNSTLR